MLDELKYREKHRNPIRVAIIGAGGAMGKGILLQMNKVPGMEVVFIADINREAAEKAQAVYGKEVKIFTNADEALEDPNIDYDVLVESSNTIGAAMRYCLKAIANKKHVVLMNAEVDLIFGPYLQHEASKHNVVVTSDAGDQHGVLMRMIEEIEMWGFNITQAGNIKGFLDRYATAETKREIAKKLNLNLIQCIAYTDGTKLNIEMALIANGANLIPFKPGMEGPKAQQVGEALKLFNFDAYQHQGRVDYLLGAEPGGGVYVIGHSDDIVQCEYLKYYKVQQCYPYYLFYRPYHLCHLETPRAIALAALWNKGVLTPKYGKKTDVYAYAKQPLRAGTEIAHGIGGDYTYGLIHETFQADAANYLPIGLLESEHHEAKARIKRGIAKDEMISLSDVELPDTELMRLYEVQQALIKKEECKVA